MRCHRPRALANLLAMFMSLGALPSFSGQEVGSFDGAENLSAVDEIVGYPDTLPLNGGNGGSLVHHVVSALIQDHDELRSAAKQLLKVRDDADNVEGELFGSVFDEHTVEQLSVNKQRIVEANQEAKREIASLKQQIEAVEARLREVELAEATPENAEEDGLDPLPSVLVQVQHQAVRLRHHTKSSAPSPAPVVAPSGVALHPATAPSPALRATSSPIPAPAPELQPAPYLPPSHLSALEEHLVEVHDFSEECHSKVEELERALRVYMAVEPKDNSTAVATLQQAKVTADAAKQRLHAEEALIKDRIARADAAGVNTLAVLRHDYGQMQALEWHLEKMANETRERIRDEEQKLEALLKQIEDEEDGLREDEQEKQSLEAQLKKIQELFTPVVYQAIIAENQALQGELNEELDMFKHLKVSEAAMVTDERQAKIAEESQRQAAQRAVDAVQAAHQDSQHQIATAVNQTQENKQRQLALISEAKAAIAERCNTEWESYGQQMNAEVTRCQAVAEQLAAAKAMKATMEQVLSSQIATA